MSPSSFSDHDHLDNISPHASSSDPFLGKACPVCSKLDFRPIVLGKPDGRGQEYCIEPSEHDRNKLHGWIEECALCRLVNDLDQHWSDHSDDDQPLQYDSHKYRFACGRKDSDTVKLNLEILADWGKSQSTFSVDRHQANSLERIDSVLIERVKHVAVHADPLSQTSIARMRHWVSRCNESDTACRVREAALPTRVLDIDNLRLIKLCDTDAFVDGQQRSYIALSHCWGLTDKTFLTTRGTIAEMRAGFPIGDAPATFRDAIKVTRCLGIRYLWIDSLCIIQHDDEDWKLEASRMGSVYANSFLTIAAANAKDDKDGFLHPRVDALTSLRIRSLTGKSAQIYLRTRKNRFNVHAYNTEEPLYTRGWALQEQYLPQRTLVFGSTQMSWKCQRFGLHESGTDTYIGISHSTRLLRPVPTNSGGLSYGDWYAMVFAFSGRTLRYDTDKLPALSGLASEVAKASNGIYYAGLWWEDMASGMLWYRDCAFEHQKTSTYLAPSWSWASLNGCILYENHPAKVILGDVVFHECYLDYQSGDLYGAVKSGWLELSAPLVKLNDCEVPDSWRIDDYGLETAFKFAHLDSPITVPTGDLNHDAAKVHDEYDTIGNFETRGIFDLVDKDHVDVFGLLLMISTNDTYDNQIRSKAPLSDPSHCSTLYGILIEKSLIGPLTYKRVGYFSAMRLDPGEEVQIFKGAEIERIRLY